MATAPAPAPAPAVTRQSASEPSTQDQVAKRLREARTNKPAKPLKKYRVHFKDETDQAKEVDAADDREAWAKYCDFRKKYPSPKTGTVIEL